MKNIKIFTLIIIACFVIFSCESTKKEVVEEISITEPEEEQVIIEEQEEILEVEEVEIPEEAAEEVEFIDEVIDIEEVELIEEEIPSEDEEEYLRSVEDLTDDEVTKEEFAEDKATVLQIISELSTIMDRKDTKTWLEYIDEESKKYYSAPANIRKAQKKLPDKTLQLHGIGDYFKYVFIPSRKRSQVDEIRYIAKNSIKAVEVKDDGSVIIYYYFVKENGKWLVHIPPLS